MRRHRENSGFSFIELFVVVAIVSIVTAIVVSSFFSATKGQALEKDASRVVALLQRARSLTLSSFGASQYGVHLASDRVVLFPGSTYNASNGANMTEMLNAMVAISTTSLSGGGSDIVFQRLTGQTANPGTFGLTLVNDATAMKVIVIQPTGLSGLQ